ncbi:unnamed protein product [Rotaria sp. Silwood1]
MATAILPVKDADNQHSKIIYLIWLDANVNIEEVRDTEQKLSSIINHLKQFQDVKQCQKFIEGLPQNERVIMIVSGRLGREIVPSIHTRRQVISIYVYCMDKESNEKWACKFAKVKAVMVNRNELISRIQADHNTEKENEQLLSISIRPTMTSERVKELGINTHASRETAISYFRHHDVSKDLATVVFEIDADPSVATRTPFAEISAHGAYPNESEVLFMLGSIFRVNNVSRKQLGNGETSLQTLGKLLWKMGKLDLAENYFMRFVEELTPNDPLLIVLYEDLGKLTSEMGKFDQSVQWQQKSMALKNKQQSVSIISIDKPSSSIEIICGLSSSKNTIIYFHHLLSMNFSQIEHHFNATANVNLILSSQKHHRFIVIFIIIGILVTIVCLHALYILCKSRAPYRHRIRLDYMIDSHVAKEAALKLAPEQV